ncbi:MAG: ATP-dependent DNA helicase [Bacteroidota bacterium]
MTINEEAFLIRYNKLNEQQRLAVDTIYGPVMVIAGPGTGKTEVLSMRIANLLRSEAQVQPHEILCLTYTDEATNSMRRRLITVIGNAAHRVNICTFHAFCNNVIQINPEYFSQRSLQPITDLERTELLYDILEKLPQGHALRKLSGNIYFDAGKLNRLFDMMKRENLRPIDIKQAIARYLEDLPTREEYIYKKSGKGYQKGDIKQTQIDEEIRRMTITDAAAALFDTYEQRMKEIGRYDFNDMIIWVLDAFKQNPALLQSYQERYQFTLVDEFQDTNGAQSELLNIITQYWDDPNVFVVGDDDQSIYEFQGARIRNIIDFYQRNRDTINVIILPQNYRSSQAIIDMATATIKNNTQRLIYQLQELQLNKNIVASAERFKNGNDTVIPEVKVYSNILHEEADIVMQMEQLQRQGVQLNEIAVIYAQHKQAENIMALMERKGMPYSVKRPVNILDIPIIQQIVNILRYLDEERRQSFSGETMLFEMMHAPYFGIAPTDIALLSLYIQANRQKDKSLGHWRLVLMNALFMESNNIASTRQLHSLGIHLEDWTQQQMVLPLPLLVEKIIYESGIVGYLLKSKDQVWNIQVLQTFFAYVKEVYDRNPRIRPADFLRMLEQMKDENISLPAQKVVQNDNGVHFYTAHGAKGNEFEYVFLIGATKNFWENKRGSNNEYKLPDTITSTEEDVDKSYKTEVARRLFYVALTRAKKHLQVSYAAKDNTGKPLETSVFVDEISTLDDRISYAVPTEDLMEHIKWAMAPIPDVRIELANHQNIEKVLQALTMSYTTLSKYLRCPLTFYYEQILKVPFLKSDALAFGSAVHYALERMFKLMKEQHGVFPSKEEVISAFKSFMFIESESFTQIQYERRLEQGNSVLSDYYDYYIDKFPTHVEIELKIPRYMLDGVPVTGKIDKIELDGDNCKVVDYKTGDPDKSATAMTAGPNEKNPNGGDYWRQMVFYKLLIENYQEKNWKVQMGMFDYVEKGRVSNQYKQIHVPIYPQDETTVLQQLKEVYGRIMNHEFDAGCGKPECTWCNFARNYELIRPAENEFVEIDDL